jgi:hypothetical protein
MFFALGCLYGWSLWSPYLPSNTATNSRQGGWPFQTLLEANMGTYGRRFSSAHGGGHMHSNPPPRSLLVVVHTPNNMAGCDW